MAPLPFLAALDAASLHAAGAGTWWRTVGGLLVVFGLLFLCLKLLGRCRRRGAATQARLLTVWHLGPRREIQVLRVGGEVSYVYRHENAMVLLRQEPWEAYVREHGEPAAGPGAPALPDFVARLLKSTPLGAAPARD